MNALAVACLLGYTGGTGCKCGRRCCARGRGSLSKKLFVSIVLIGVFSLAKAGLASPGVTAKDGLSRADIAGGTVGNSSNAASNASADMLTSFGAGHSLGIDFLAAESKKCDDDHDKDDKDCKKYCKNDKGKTTAVIDNGKGSCKCVLDGGVIDKKNGTCKCAGKRCPPISR